jgi:gamma-glutamyltranspeptidase/glutathione hydrolase
MGLQEAINAPRFHFQNGVLSMEASLAAEVGEDLRGRGYQLREHHDHDYFFGGVNAIQVQDGVFVGGADPRRDGVAVAY